MTDNTETRLAVLETIMPRVEKNISSSLDNLSKKIEDFTKEMKEEKRQDSQRIYGRISELEKLVLQHDVNQKKDLALAYLFSKYTTTAMISVFSFAFLSGFFGKAVWEIFHKFL